MRRLTKQVIDETPFPSAGQVFVRDAELPGFALRVTKGRKSFILEKRIRGRMRRFTIGPSGESAGVSGVMSTPESTRHTAAGFAGGSRYGTQSAFAATAWAV